MKRPTPIPYRLFVTGTDTEVGKTVISAALCRGLHAGYWKPVQAGTEPMTDTESIRNWTALPDNHFYPERYKLKLPMSPHEAARREGLKIQLSDFQVPACRQKNLIVEGAGGILVPLNKQDMIADLIRQLNLPVLLVARSGLGTINHTLLSIQVLRHYEIKIWGVVLNGVRHASNEEAVRYYGKIDNLYSFPKLDQINPEKLKQNFQKTFLANAS